jgi:hypothetical protein|eukprot:COSAG01_NODE_168_length_23206_cov_14.301467_11_plen_71_part_00
MVWVRKLLHSTLTVAWYKYVATAVVELRDQTNSTNFTQFPDKVTDFCKLCALDISLSNAPVDESNGGDPM